MSGIVPDVWRVVARRDEAPSVVTLDLAPVAGRLPTFRPAQVNMLCVPGVGEVPISVSSDPADDRWHSHTIRAAGPVTAALAALAPGDEVGVRGPYGTSWDCESAEGCDVVAVAGGIGLAPLRSAIETVARRRNSYGRVLVLVGARTPADVVFAADLDRWRARDIDVRVTVDHADASWTGPVGLVTALLDDVALDASRTTLWVCGPDRMMQAVGALAVARCVPASCVRLTLERNMRCAVALCGHCQLGPLLVCRDGPVVTYDRIASFYDVPEV